MYINFSALVKALTGLLNVGISLTNAETNFAEWYEKWAETHRAIIEVEIQNFADVALTGGDLLVNKGITRAPFVGLIEEGSREGFAWRQNKPEGTKSGVEFCGRYTINAGNYYLVFCAKAYQQTLWRESNELSVCIIHKSKINDPDSYDEWIDNSCSTPMKIQNIVKTMQCCNSKYCDQASMDTNHQPKAIIRFWPKKIQDMKYSIVELEHSDLNEILDYTESCDSGNGKHSGAMSGANFLKMN